MSIATGSAMAALDRGHLIVGTGSTNTPWHFNGANGDLVGFEIDMAKLIAKGLYEGSEKIDPLIPSLSTRF